MGEVAAEAGIGRFDGRHLVALAVPVAIPVAMSATFVVARDALGDHLGYIAGFGAYWAACGGLAVAILGRDRVRCLFIDRRPRLGRPAAVGAALLIWPMAGAIATRLMPDLADATVAMAATAIAVALTNSVLEELLWRGVYITLWPEDPWLGWVWPAVGFGLWHLAPQIIHPSSLGPLAYVVAATALGLSWGWVAWQSKSLRWVTVSHFLTDGSGIRNVVFFLGT